MQFVIYRHTVITHPIRRSVILTLPRPSYPLPPSSIILSLKQTSLSSLSPPVADTLATSDLWTLLERHLLRRKTVKS